MYNPARPSRRKQRSQQRYNAYKYKMGWKWIPCPGPPASPPLDYGLDVYKDALARAEVRRFPHVASAEEIQANAHNPTQVRATSLTYYYESLVQHEGVISSYLTNDAFSLAALEPQLQFPPPAGTVGLWQRCFLMIEAVLEIIVTNPSHKRLTLDVWHVKARSDNAIAGDTPSTTWRNGVESLKGAGIAAAPDPARGYGNPASMPSDSEAFSQFWRVFERQRTVIPPGQSVTIMHRGTPNFHVTGLQMDSNYMNYFGGITSGVMLRGMCELVVGASDVFPNPVFGATNYQVAVNHRQTFRDTSAVSYSSLTYGSNGTTSAITEVYVDPLSGVARPYTAVIAQEALPIQGAISAGGTNLLSVKRV